MKKTIANTIFDLSRHVTQDCLLCKSCFSAHLSSFPCSLSQPSYPQEQQSQVTINVHGNYPYGVSSHLSSPLHTMTSLAPALDALEYYELDFENEFEESSTYRGPPTLARENAWAELWDCEKSSLLPVSIVDSLCADSVTAGLIFKHASVNIPASKLHLLNKTADSQDWRKNPDGNGYSATLDVFHQLHCLVRLRCPIFHSNIQTF